MTNWSYALQSLACLLTGLSIGFIAGYLARARIEERRAVMPETPAVATQRRWWRRWPRPKGYHLLGVAVSVMALVSAVLLSRQVAAYNSASDCLASYQETYTEVLRQRDNINAGARQDARVKTTAERRMWDTLVANAAPAGQQPTPTQRESMIAALRDYFGSSDAYLKALDRADQARLQYPVPPNNCPRPRGS